jgi:hypothetical protein
METMRLTSLTTRLVTSAALGIVLAAAVLAAPAPARAADDDVAPDTKFLQGLLEAIGLQGPNSRPDIHYHERAPLAIPQADTLPPPQAPGAAVANNPAWPKDADRARVRLEKERNRNRDTTTEMIEDSYPLRPDQMTPGRSSARVYTQRPNSPPNPSIGAGGTDRLTPSELGYQGGLFSKMFGKDEEAERAATFTGEPPRTSLTDPPKGYQTPSPEQPFGLSSGTVAPKAQDYFTTHGELKD